MRWIEAAPVVALLVVLAGCASHATTGATTSSSTSGKPHPCTPARGIDQGIELTNGTYAAADGSVWRESNGLPHLQEIVTCEGPADTKVAPPVHEGEGVPA